MNYPKYQDNIEVKDKIRSKIWLLVWFMLVRPFQGRIFNRWRIFFYRVFGASISQGCVIRSSARILSPWRLTLGARSTIGPNVNIDYGEVWIGNMVTVSQNSSIITGGHDIKYRNLPYYSKKIVIESYVWIAADCFVGPGVKISEGSILGARAVLFKDTERYSVYIGNPAVRIKSRVIIQ